MAEAQDIQDFQFLGREFLTWLLWKADQGQTEFESDEGAFTVRFVGRVRLSGLAGDVVAAVLDGASAAYSIEARAAIGAGRTIREATLRFAQGEREWTAAVSDLLDLRSVKLPAVLTEEEDDRFLERMDLLGLLSQMIHAAFAVFVRERVSPAWRAATVPAIGQWVSAALAAT